MGFKKIAIDGPAGAGKSVISKRIASCLNYVHMDTGAMYRACALKMIKSNVNIKDEPEKVLDIMENINLEIKYSKCGQEIFLDGENVTDKIRTNEVSMGASEIAISPKVREKLVCLQRELAKSMNCIVDGRDIGTNVFPDADVKIFLTASCEERARRRYLELVQKGQNVTMEEVLEDVKQRDLNDTTREFAPLKCADDAVLVDTTGSSLEQAVDLLKNIIENNLKEV